MRSISYQDGSAAAGPLSEALGIDITAAQLQCAHCAHRGAVAEGHLYTRGPGLTLRCPQCKQVLLRLALAEGDAWLDMSGVDYLRLARG